MAIFNRRDVSSAGLAAAILCLAGATSAQAKQHVWMEEKDASNYAAAFGMPAAGSQAMQSTTLALDCTRAPARGCVSDEFDSIINVYIYDLPLTHGGPR